MGSRNQAQTAITGLAEDRERRGTSLRFRCTEKERRRWHQMANELTNDHNQLSQLVRAAFRLIEDSFDELKTVSPEIQSLKRPARNDSGALEVYEKKLSEVLFKAILKRTGAEEK